MWGDEEEFLYDVWEKSMVEPAALSSKPDLGIDLLEYYKAFRVLSPRRSRSAMGGVQPITMVDLQAYLQIFGTNDEDAFVFYLSAMDTALLKFIRSKEEQQVRTPARK